MARIPGHMLSYKLYHVSGKNGFRLMFPVVLGDIMSTAQSTYVQECLNWDDGSATFTYLNSNVEREKMHT